MAIGLHKYQKKILTSTIGGGGDRGDDEMKGRHCTNTFPSNEWLFAWWTYANEQTDGIKNFPQRYNRCRNSEGAILWML